MKRINIFLALILSTAFLVASCTKGPKDLIAKKWKFSVEDMKKEFTANQEKELANMPDSLKESSKAMMELTMKMMEEMFAKASVEFKSDGTFEASEGDKTSKGKWTISEDGKKITMTEEGKEERSSDIIELTASKLVLQDKTMKITFIPA